jgi:hypothetical protein
MQAKQLDTQDAGSAYSKQAAYLDVKRRSELAKQQYSTAQQQEAEALQQLTRQAFMRSRVYLTYRDKFYTVKIEKPTSADRLTREASNIEQMFSAIGAEKAITAQGTIYRVKRK